MATKLRTRINASGYHEFFDRRTGRWELTHRRAVENTFGETLPQRTHVHHVNGDKTDNRRRNLVPLEPEVHGRIHREDPDACFHCGRSGRRAADCTRRTRFDGAPIRDPYDAMVAGGDDDDDDDEFDDDEFDDDDDDFDDGW